MTHDELWNSKWLTATEFIKKNGRNPSKFDGAEREIRNWIRHSKKLMNAGLLKEERIEKFKELLALSEMNKHMNQYE